MSSRSCGAPTRCCGSTRRSSSSSARRATPARKVCEAALAIFAARGYEGSFVSRGRLVPVERFDPAVHQKRSDGRFWDAPGYCNNFVMRKGRG